MTPLEEAKTLKRCGYLAAVPLSDLANPAALQGAPLLGDRQCGHPDYADEEIAKSDIADLVKYLDCLPEEADFLKTAHSRMWEATGSGSFPSGCYPDLFPKNHAAKVYLDFDSFPAHYTRTVTDSELNQILEAGTWGMTKEQIFDKWAGKPMLTVAMELTNECYRIIGCAHVMTTDGENGQHNIHIKAEYIPGGVIGYAFFNNGTCRDHVNQRIDSSWRPSLHSCAHLLAHECGHNHNLPHTFTNQGHHRGIMSYNSPRLFYGYSTGKSPHSLPRDPSLSKLIRFYGGEPVPVETEPTDPDPPDPTPDPETITVKVDRLPVNLRIEREGSDPGDPPIIF